MRSVALELVDEFAIQAAEREAIRRLLAEAFPDAAFTASRTYGKQIPARRLLARRTGRTIGHLGLEHRVIGTATGPANLFGIVDLCVASSERGEGIATAMLGWIESLAGEHGIEFLMLFAQDTRLYERLGYRRAGNPLRWLRVHEHASLGIGEQPLEELMVKPVASRPWPEGPVDLLGTQF